MTRAELINTICHEIECRVLSRQLCTDDVRAVVELAVEMAVEELEPPDDRYEEDHKDGADHVQSKLDSFIKRVQDALDRDDSKSVILEAIHSLD